MSMTKTQFNALLDTLREKLDAKTMKVIEAYNAVVSGIANNTTGLSPDQLAKVKAEFEAIKGRDYTFDRVPLARRVPITGPPLVGVEPEPEPKPEPKPRPTEVEYPDGEHTHTDRGFFGKRHFKPEDKR